MRDYLLSKTVEQLATIINRMNKMDPIYSAFVKLKIESVLNRLKEKIDSMSRRSYELIHADTQDERGIDVAFLYDKTSLKWSKVK